MTDVTSTPPQVPRTGGGREERHGWLPQWAGGGSSSAQLLMPCYPQAIHHGSLRVRYVLPPNHPHLLTPSIPHFPLWVSAVDSCQDRTDAPRTPTHREFACICKAGLNLSLTALFMCIWALHCWSLSSPKASGFYRSSAFTVSLDHYYLKVFNSRE